MQIAQVLAGYSLGEADLLRRAMGKKISKEMAAQRDRFVSGAVEQRRRARPRPRRSSTCLREIRRLRLQQEPRRGLRAGRLSDRVSEGELPGRVPGGVDDARHGQYRQARRIPPRGRAAQGIKVVSAVGQSLRPRVRGRTRARSSTRSRRSKASAGTPWTRSWRRAVTSRSWIWPTSPRASIRARSTSARWRAWPRPAPSTVWSRTAPRPSLPVRRHARATRSARRAIAAIGPVGVVRRRAARGRRCGSRRSSHGCRRSGLKREYDAIGFFLSGHPLDDYAVALAAHAGAALGRVSQSVARRRDCRARSPRPSCRAWSGARAPAARWRIIGLSDPTGHFEAVIFQEGLAQYRDLLEPGTAVLLQVGAETQGEDVRVRIYSAELARRGGGEDPARSARVHELCRSRSTLVAKRLNGMNGNGNGKGEATGEVSIVLVLPDGAPRSR